MTSAQVEQGVMHGLCPAFCSAAFPGWSLNTSVETEEKCCLNSRKWLHYKHGSFASSFVPPCRLQTPSQVEWEKARTWVTKCESSLESEEPSKDEGGRVFKHKFDPDSETDAFGRDPKKETEFWMGAAKSVLDSSEVREAIEKHKEAGGDGLTDEQRAYMEFIKSMDEKSTKDS